MVAGAKITCRKVGLGAYALSIVHAAEKKPYAAIREVKASHGRAQSYVDFKDGQGNSHQVLVSHKEGIVTGVSNLTGFSNPRAKYLALSMLLRKVPDARFTKIANALRKRSGH